MGLFGAGDPPCPAGSICSGQARTFVGKKTKTVKQNVRGGGTVTKEVASEPGTGIYHSSATKINSDGTSTTDVYIIKDNKWQKAASSNDGGKTYTYNDDVAGAGFKNELNNPQGGIHKNIDAGVNKAADKAGVPPTTKNTLLDSTKNNADNDNSASNDNTTPAAAAEPEADTNRSGTRTEFPNLRYPVNLADTKQDIIKFDMHEYVPSKAAGGTSQFGFTRGELGPSIGSVVLPIPSGISDQNKADWGSNSMTALDIAKADVAKQTIFKGFSAGAETINSYISKAKNNSGELGDAVGNSLAAAAAGVEGQALLSRTTGQVLNPNMELLFKGPALRPFSFKFKLSPRDANEANEVIKIMRFFKQGSAPIRSTSNLFLKSPHIFKIKYIRMGENGELHRGLNAFKACALQSFGVNYTPTGNYATYSDGIMVSYDITMSFSEITPIFNDDYTIGDQFIGF